MVMDQTILDWQNSLPSFGISYSGPRDGQLNPSFIEAMMNLEGKYQAYSQIFTGSGIKMSVSEAKKKFLNVAEVQEPPKTLNQESPKLDDSKKWEAFLSQNLPVVGKLYNGDLATAGQALENIIGGKINKPMVGIIWNDTKKQFNTTPEDVQKALELIQNHSQSEIKSSEFTLDQRVIRMSQILLEKNK